MINPDFSMHSVMLQLNLGVAQYVELPADAVVKVFDMHGRQVPVLRYGSLMNFSELPAGTYYLQARLGGWQQTLRIRNP